MFLAIPHLYRAVTAKHPLHYRSWKSNFRVFEGDCRYLLLMVDFGEYQKTLFLLHFFVAGRLHSQHSRHFGYFLCLVNFACLKVLELWMRRLGLFLYVVWLHPLHVQHPQHHFHEKNEKGLKIPCTPLASANRSDFNM